MDQDSPVGPQINQDENASMGQRQQSSSEYESKQRQIQENKVVRRPGRPPSRTKSRQKQFIKSNQVDNYNDDDFQTQRPRFRQKTYSSKEQRENTIQGFIKIIDYLKRIQCDEASLHNKMNPYNLLTPTCFWYMVSAQYFSYDFFNNKNPQQLALQFLKKAQKTQIILPSRIIKPLRTSIELEFETEQLKQQAIPVTEKLINLTNNITVPCQVYPQVLEKSNFISSIVDDNHFRSSTRAIVFNWIKKKLSTSQKWNGNIKPKLQGATKVSAKEFTSKVYESQQQKKHEQLDAAPQVAYRQRQIQKNPIQIKRNRQPRKATREKKGSKRQKQNKQDEIYDESQSLEIKKQAELGVDQNLAEKEEVQQMRQQHIQKQEKIQDQIKMQPNIQTDLKMQLKKDDIGQNQFNQDQEQNSDEPRNGLAKAHQYLTFNKNYGQDDLLLDAIMHLPLDNIINVLKSSIQTPRLHQISRPYMPIPKNDPLELVYQIHPQQDTFLNYMRERQEKIYFQKSNHTQSMIQQKQRQGQVQDAKCQVCTDGDYTQDNLIVFCSMCNISLHQRCVGLAKVPADNWICEVCASFGPAGINVPCPLCHVKGGALKRTSIHINTPLFKDTNPQYHQFAKKCPNYKHKQQYSYPGRVAGVKGEEQPYYDYFSKASYPQDQPICHFVWVHYVCAIWIPQCYFEQKNGLINIKGIQNIDKRRFKQRCLICKQIRAGACAKCDNQNCNKYYHPECARKKKIYMEQLNLDKLKYLIFCQAHEPLKVKRKIEIKKKKQRDQIVKFCRGIQKYVQTYKIANLPFKLLKIGINCGIDSSKLDSSKKQKIQIRDQKIMIKLEKNTDQDFIKSVIDGLIKQNQIVVNVSHLGNNKFKIDEVIKPSKRDMRKSLTRQQQFWKNFKNNQTPEINLKRFNTIMRENNYLKQKIENFINFGSSAQDRFDGKKDPKSKSGRRGNRMVQTVVQQQGAIFCVCRRPYNGQDDMFQCQVCNQWYHHQCIGFVGSQEDAQNLVFHCMKCLKYESPQVKKQLLDKCSKYFSEDSLFLNYRPPTPSLQSDQQNIQEARYLYKKPDVNVNKKQTREFGQFGGRSDKNQKLRSKHHIKQMSCFEGDVQQQKINIYMPFIIQNTIVSGKQQGGGSYQQNQQQNKSVQNQQRNQEDIDIEKKADNEEMQQKQIPAGDHEQPSIQNLKISAPQSLKNEVPIQSNQVSSNFARAYSSQSSQLLTPQFRPSVVSFGPIDEQYQEKSPRKIVEQDQNIQISKRPADSVQNRQSQNYCINRNLQFDRGEIERLKHSIQQNQDKGQKDNPNDIDQE